MGELEPREGGLGALLGGEAEAWGLVRLQWVGREGAWGHLGLCASYGPAPKSRRSPEVEGAFRLASGGNYTGAAVVRAGVPTTYRPVLDSRVQSEPTYQPRGISPCASTWPPTPAWRSR